LDKIVLVYQKRDGRMNDLLKCLKYLFPECSAELKSPDKKSCLSEKIHTSSELYFM
jgi:hypothetical protein